MNDEPVTKRRKRPRPKKTGSIFKPKGSRFWWLAYYQRGRRYYESSKSENKDVAQARLTDRLGDIGKGIVVSAKVGTITLGDGLDAVVANLKMNGRKTAAHTRARIDKHLLEYFNPDNSMAAITTADIEKYKTHRLDIDGAQPATINRELAALRRAFRLARRGGALVAIPDVPLLSEHNVRVGFFERDEFGRVREALPIELRGVVTLAYFTGWRTASEILPLTWAQVDRRTMVIRLDPGTTKNSKGRTLPYALLPELIDVVEAAWTSHEALKASDRICPFVFHRNGKRIRTFRGTWLTTCKAAGCPGKLLHDFRRTAVRNLVRHGVPEKQAMGVTGHLTRSVFDRYDIVNEADLRDALGKLADRAADTPPSTSAVRQFR